MRLTLDPIHLAWASLAGLLLSGGVAAASDGVLEINQTCAVNTGCFSGDAAGFPVTITQPGSYRLTGALDVSGLPSGTTGVDIDASYVTLDLNGYSIMGPASCTGFGATLSCSPGPTGSLAGTGIIPRSTHAVFTIRNGIIRGMTGAAISGDGDQVVVEAIHAVENSGGGIYVDQNSIVRNSLSRHNGGNGFDVDQGSIVESSTSDGNANNGLEVDGTAVVRGSTFRGNGNNGVLAQSGAAVAVSDSAALLNALRGFWLQPRSKFRSNVSDGNLLPDDCGGGICTEKRRLRRVPGLAGDWNVGGNPCPDGFEPASYHDILSPSDLAWDGASSSAGGWITGLAATCSGWTSTSGIGYRLSVNNINDPMAAYEDRIGLRWDVLLENCASVLGLVCVEEY